MSAAARKICVVTGARADYGLLRWVMHGIRDTPGLELQVAEGKQPETGVTVAELLRQYMTVAELDRATRQTYEGYIRRQAQAVQRMERTEHLRIPASIEYEKCRGLSREEARRRARLEVWCSGWVRRSCRRADS